MARHASKGDLSSGVVWVGLIGTQERLPWRHPSRLSCACGSAMRRNRPRSESQPWSESNLLSAALETEALGRAVELANVLHHEHAGAGQVNDIEVQLPQSMLRRRSLLSRLRPGKAGRRSQHPLEEMRSAGKPLLDRIVDGLSLKLAS